MKGWEENEVGKLGSWGEKDERKRDEEGNGERWREQRDEGGGRERESKRWMQRERKGDRQWKWKR